LIVFFLRFASIYGKLLAVTFFFCYRWCVSQICRASCKYVELSLFLVFVINVDCAILLYVDKKFGEGSSFCRIVKAKPTGLELISNLLAITFSFLFHEIFFFLS